MARWCGTPQAVSSGQAARCAGPPAPAVPDLRPGSGSLTRKSGGCPGPTTTRRATAGSWLGLATLRVRLTVPLWPSFVRFNTHPKQRV
jgi:hypothetical protein